MTIKTRDGETRPWFARRVFAAAMTAWDARKLVALKTAPDVSARTQSPWLDDGMTRCTWDRAKRYVPKGAVETGTGRVIA
jgi:hypothetical protein